MLYRKKLLKEVNPEKSNYRDWYILTLGTQDSSFFQEKYLGIVPALSWNVIYGYKKKKYFFYMVHKKIF